jgi:hypothetical protein
MSCCEAEYIAAATMGCQAVWLTPLLFELRYIEVLVPVQSVDNKSTISLIKNPIHHGRSKTHWCKISSASGIMKIQTRLLCISWEDEETFSQSCRARKNLVNSAARLVSEPLQLGASRLWRRIVRINA